TIELIGTQNTFIVQQNTPNDDIHNIAVEYLQLQCETVTRALPSNSSTPFSSFAAAATRELLKNAFTESKS
ncbi:hypothetical protein GN958_ATG12607, partial [Phytophthora infestans]